MQPLDNMDGRHADGTDEQFRSGLNDDLYQFIEFALCVVVAA